MQNNLPYHKLRILVAPLDWGLGHTTRCVPIVKALIECGVTVVLAGNEWQKKVWLAEFPQCKFILLQGYNVQYSRQKLFFSLKILQQIPKVLRVIKNEHHWLQSIIVTEKIDAVISDNRYGLHTKLVPTVFITHQLLIKNPYRFIQAVLQKINYKWIQKFDTCWVPDLAETPNLSGILGHPKKMPKGVSKYIGVLSRLQKTASAQNNSIVFLLSGPEPQRTLLEQKVIASIKHIAKQDCIIIRGTQDKLQHQKLSKNITIFDYLSSDKLNEILNKAGVIICRSGYSSVMDIAVLQKKAFLIPTMGQTEQEYLAKHLEDIGFAPSGSQANFDINAVLERVQRFSYQTFNVEEDKMKKAVENWIATLAQGLNR